MFGVSHYAGTVVYSTRGLLARNRDLDGSLATLLMENSTLTAVDAIFPQEDNGGGGGGGAIGRRKSRRRSSSFSASPTRGGGFWNKKKRGKSAIMRGGGGGGGLGSKSKKAAQTVGAAFRDSLFELIAKVETTTPHFVRCIKPNNAKLSGMFVGSRVGEQLRHTGVMETAKIRREGFAVRPAFADFATRYKVLKYPLTATIALTAGTCKEILAATTLQGWQLGKTKVFLKYQHHAVLLELLAGFNRAADVIGRAWRTLQARRRWEAMMQVLRRRADAQRAAAAARDAAAARAAAVEAEKASSSGGGGGSRGGGAKAGGRVADHDAYLSGEDSAAGMYDSDGMYITESDEDNAFDFADPDGGYEYDEVVGAPDTAFQESSHPGGAALDEPDPAIVAAASAPTPGPVPSGGLLRAFGGDDAARAGAGGAASSARSNLISRGPLVSAPASSTPTASAATATAAAAAAASSSSGFGAGSKAATVTRGNVGAFRAMFQAQSDAEASGKGAGPNQFRRKLTFQKLPGYGGRGGVRGLASQLSTLAEEGQIKDGPAMPKVRRPWQPWSGGGSSVANSSSGPSVVNSGSGGGGGGGGGRPNGGNVGKLMPMAIPMGAFGAPPPSLFAATRLPDDVVELLARLSLMRTCATATATLGINAIADFDLFSDEEMMQEGFPASSVVKLRNEMKEIAKRKKARRKQRQTKL